MKLNQFSERIQNNIMMKAIKYKTDIIEYKGNDVIIPDKISVLYVCSSISCNNTRDVTYYRQDVLDGHIPYRIKCQCGEQMTRKWMCVNTHNVLKKYYTTIDNHERGIDYYMNYLN